MKLRLFSARFALAFSVLGSIRAQQAATATTPESAPSATAPTPTSELTQLVAKIRAKLQAHQSSAEDLAPELAAFDALIAKYQDQKTDEVAQIAFMKATLILQVLNDTDKGTALLTKLKSDYPGSKPAKMADQVIEQIQAQVQAEAAKKAVVGKPAPELHFSWVSNGDLKTLSSLKGKVVVLDFWATWCGPCIASFPHVRELVEHYKGSDVVVIGVTSLQGRVVNLQPTPIDTSNDPAKEKSLMPDFIKAKEMTWTVAISDEEVFNPEFGVTGIPHMAIIAPDGTVRHNGFHPAIPLEEKTTMIDAILKEFKLPAPAAAAAKS